MVEFSDGDFELSNEIQQDFVINRGPGYSSEILNSIGCNRDDLVNNSGRLRYSLNISFVFPSINISQVESELSEYEREFCKYFKISK